MKPVFIDTNIPIYAAGKPHPNKKPCAQVIMAMAKGEIQTVSSAEVLQEILHRHCHTKERAKGVKMLHEFRELVSDIFPVTIKEVNMAATFLEKYPNIEARDAIHIATMLTNDIKLICSTDKHFDDINEIKRISPEEVTKEENNYGQDS
ncbi:type II toxin-antitoxin system VapC family toxin [bacterium]|nr:type II toxin-antitoxin system VapC family toxin [bacterium]